jgi:O-antigen/teichoic acid export membrane protein
MTQQSLESERDVLPPGARGEDAPPAGAFGAAGGDVPAAADDSHHRATRRRRLGLAIVTSLCSRALALVIPLVCLPLFVRYLGKEGYGLYETVAALAVWLSLTNAGLYMGLQNRLQDCHVSGDRALARGYVSSVWTVLAAGSLVGVIVITVVTPLINWNALLEISTPQVGRATGAAFWCASVIAFANIVVSLPGAVYSAHQELHVANLWEGVGRVATIVASVAVVWTNFGLPGVVIASAGAPALVRGVNFAWFFIGEKPWLRPSLRLFDARLLRGTLSDGLYAFILQMAVVAIYQSDKLIIGVALTPERVTPYAVVGRLFLVAYGAYFILLMPLWPAYGDALRRGDVNWVRRGVRWSLLVGCGGVALCGLTLLMTGHWVIPLWTRTPGIVVSRSLILAMTATFVLRAWIDARTIAFNAVGAFRPQIVFFAAHAVLNFILAVALAKPYGVEGVAWATPISALLTSAWGYPVLMRRLLRERQASASASAAAGAGAAAPGGAAG